MTPSPAAQIAVLAGLDPTGGAGLLRDCWVCRSLAPQLRIEALCTALTDQCPQASRPAALRLVPGASFRAELQALRAALWKVGMMQEAALACLVEELKRRAQPPRIVCDPLLRASDGGQLGAPPRHWSDLWPYCSWITPNYREFLDLGGQGGGDEPCGLNDAMKEGKGWWIKSVNATREEIADELHLEGQILRISRGKTAGPDPRGTGCALSTALAVAMHEERESEVWPLGYTLQRWQQGRWALVSSEEATRIPRLAPVIWAMRWLDRARTRLHRPFAGRWQLRTDAAE